MIRWEVLTLKKFLVCFLLLSLLATAAAAEAPADLSALSVDQLTQLRDAVSLELAARAPADDALGVWVTGSGVVKLLEIRRGTLKDGGPGVALIFSWTNTAEAVDTFRAHQWVTLYHDGVEQETTIMLDGALVGNDTWGAKVMPGRTLQRMQWFFSLTGTENTIDVEIEDRTGYPTKSAGILTFTLPE